MLNTLLNILIRKAWVVCPSVNQTLRSLLEELGRKMVDKLLGLMLLEQEPNFYPFILTKEALIMEEDTNPILMT